MEAVPKTNVVRTFDENGMIILHYIFNGIPLNLKYGSYDTLKVWFYPNQGCFFPKVNPYVKLTIDPRGHVTEDLMTAGPPIAITHNDDGLFIL